MASAVKSDSSMLGVVRRNPELVKAMMASGLQRSASIVGMAFCVSNLRPMVWGQRTAQNVAIMGMMLNVIAITCGGLFGRFGDRVGRRVAAGVYGLASFVPAWTILVFGFNRTGLYVSSIAFVLSGVSLCSDAILVLANEVTRPEDRGVAFGMFQGATNLVAFILFGIPALLITMLKVLPSPPLMGFLLYHVCLSALFFVMVCTIRMPEGSGGRKADAGEGEDLERQAPAAEEGGGGPLAMVPLLSPLLLVWGHPPLRRLCLAGVLLAFCGDLVYDIGSQFFRDELGLLPYGTLEENQLVSVLTTLPSEILIIPGSLLVGKLAGSMGSLRLLRVMIPLSAALTAAGALMALRPEYWMVPVACVAQNYAALASNVPLKHLVAQAAPEGRVGEAMGAFGMGLMATGFVANGITATLTPILYAHLRKPLWIYYLLCGFLTLLAAIPMRGSFPEESERGGGGAGKAEKGAVAAATPTAEEGGPISGPAPPRRAATIATVVPAPAPPAPDVPRAASAMAVAAAAGAAPVVAAAKADVSASGGAQWGQMHRLRRANSDPTV